MSIVYEMEGAWRRFAHAPVDGHDGGDSELLDVLDVVDKVRAASLKNY